MPIKTRFLAALLALALLPAHAQDVVNPQTDQSQLTRNRGQLPGTTTNDDATAGKIGEFVKIASDFSTATVTFTNASPTVVTWTGHPYPLNTASGVVTTSVANFTNSGGALPTGVSTATNYYAVAIDANSLHIATSVANALAGTFVNTSSTGTGTQTGKAQLILATGSSLDWGGMALTAGDWDCSGTVGYVPSSTMTLLNAWLNTTTATAVGALGVASSSEFGASFASAQIQQIPINPTRVLIASTTNIFFSQAATFASTANAYAVGRCRRTR